ncbi:hypothetical protein LINPERHAP1_LOCUS26004, partial [Linum perenne]
SHLSATSSSPIIISSASSLPCNHHRRKSHSVRSAAQLNTTPIAVNHVCLHPYPSSISSLKNRAELLCPPGRLGV